MPNSSWRVLHWGARVCMCSAMFLALAGVYVVGELDDYYDRGGDGDAAGDLASMLADALSEVVAGGDGTIHANAGPPVGEDYDALYAPGGPRCVAQQ